MPNLAFELDQLELADEHILRAELQLTGMMANLKRQEGHPSRPIRVHVDAVRAAEQSLEAFYAHRALIQQVIQDIRDGRLADTGLSGKAGASWLSSATCGGFFPLKCIPACLI